MLINISDIKVRKRVRRSLGDLETLKDSLRRYGLLNPITINHKNELIAGQRRLEAAKQLGWTTINAQQTEINDKVSLLEMELEENTQRSNFTDEELINGYEALDRLRNPSFFDKLIERFKDFLTGVNETSETKKIEKAKKALFLACLLPFGILIIILGAVLFNKGFISSLLRNFLDLISIISIIIGILYSIRVYFLKK